MATCSKPSNCDALTFQAQTNAQGMQGLLGQLHLDQHAAHAEAVNHSANKDDALVLLDQTAEGSYQILPVAITRQMRMLTEASVKVDAGCNKSRRSQLSQQSAYADAAASFSA